MKQFVIMDEKGMVEYTITHGKTREDEDEYYVRYGAYASEHLQGKTRMHIITDDLDYIIMTHAKGSDVNLSPLKARISCSDAELLRVVFNIIENKIKKHPTRLTCHQLVGSMQV